MDNTRLSIIEPSIMILRQKSIVQKNEIWGNRMKPNLMV